MIDEKKFYEETNHLIDSRDIYRYIKTLINPYGRPFEGTIFEFGNKLMDYIIRMEKQPKLGEWIPCSKQLPEESDYYMACIYNRDVDDFDFRKTWFAHVDDYDMEELEWRELYDFETVTAWQPLPLAYKGE